MILAVCPNPAVDVTYRYAGGLTTHATHRVTDVRRLPGGKALNVARVLHRLGEPVSVLAPVGGATGAELRDGLAARGIAAHLVESGPTRQTVTVVDDAGATLFSEPGAPTGARDWARFVAAYDRLLPDVALAVLSGSLPPGVPADAYRDLAARAAALGVPVVLDAEGEPLRRALRARPSLVKPNLAELASVVDGPLTTPEEIADAARRTRRLGARDVVVSCGADGVLAVTDDGSWRARAVRAVGGGSNPTGAGDALVAGLVLGALRGSPWPDRLRDAVTLATAAVASPVAGELDPDVAAGCEVRVEPLPEPSTKEHR